jgi:hypothetical protein
MLTVRLGIIFCLLASFNLKAQSSQDSLAQEVPAQDSLAQEEPPEEEEKEVIEKKNNKHPFNYQAYLNGNLSIGNVNRVLIQLGNKISYKPNDIFKFAMNPYFAYGEQNGAVAERELFADFNTSVWYKKRFYLLGFTCAEVSNLRKIESRYMGGAGVGFRIIERTDKFFLSVTNALLYESTTFKDKGTFPRLRNSSRVVGDYKFAKNKLTLHHELLVQPTVDFSNVRLNGSIALGVSILKNLEINLNFRTSYESFVVVNTKNWDFNWSFGLKYSNH